MTHLYRVRQIAKAFSARGLNGSFLATKAPMGISPLLAFPGFDTAGLRPAPPSVLHSSVNLSNRHFSSGQGHEEPAPGEHDRAIGPAPGEHDRTILDLLDRGYVDEMKLDHEFAKIYKTESAKLQMSTFLQLVRRFQKIRNPGAAQLVPPFILGWMPKFHQDNRLNTAPFAPIFGMTLHCFALSHHPDAAKMAEQFLHDVEKLVEQEVLGTKVLHIISYNIVMDIYAKQGNAEKAQAIFDLSMKCFEAGSESARPGIKSWGILINAYSKSGKPDAGKLALQKVRDAEKAFADGVLKEPPNEITYNTVIAAFAQAKRPKEAENVLEEMNRAYLAGNAAARPNAASFNAVMNAWVQAGTLEGAERSEKILNHMIKLFEDESRPVRPDAISYGVVISAYGRQGLPREASRVLDQQHQDFLNGNVRAELGVRSFLGVIDGWSKSGEPITGEMAEKILDKMEEHYKQGVVKERPHVHMYTAVIKAWGKVAQPEKAELVFQRMCADYESGNNAATRPTVHTYCTLMNTYSVAKLPDAGKRADDAWDHMLKMKVEPNLYVYTAANSCWRCSKSYAEKRCTELDAQIERLN